VGQAVVSGQLDLLGIDQYEAQLVRSEPRQERAKHAVDHARLPAAGLAGNEQVRAAREITVDRLAIETKPERERQRCARRRQLIEADDAPLCARDFDGDQAGAIR
jgi:hypothetical protein